MYIGIRDVTLSRVGAAEPLEFAKGLGIDTMEIRIQPDGSLDSFDPGGRADLTVAHPEGSKLVLDSSREAGIVIGAILLNTRYHQPDVDSEEEIRWIDTAARFARTAGIAVIRIDIRPADGETEQGFLDRVSPVLEHHLATAADQGVGLSVENHGLFANREDSLSRLLDRFAKTGLSLTLDSGNFYCTGGYPLLDTYRLIDRFAASATQVHIKNIRYPENAREVTGHLGCEYAAHSAPIYEGDVDHARVVSALKRAGFEGGLYIEDESLGKYGLAERATNIEMTVAHLREIIEEAEA